MEIIKINRTHAFGQKVLVINISNKESLGVYMILLKIIFILIMKIIKIYTSKFS